MALILNIDTATDHASVALCSNGNLLSIRNSDNQKEHAGFLHIAIEDLIKEQKIVLNEVEAFAVTSGPGSYTGLRVGMATAKGLCYALQKPLICVNTLQVMSFAASKVIVENKMTVAKDQLLCPMIDARRMEVFMALYSMDLEEVDPTRPIVLSEEFFKIFENKHAYFFGNGSKKLLETTQNKWDIIDVITSAEHLGKLSEILYCKRQFSDVIYSEPQYFKEFYTVSTK